MAYRLSINIYRYIDYDLQPQFNRRRFLEEGGAADAAKKPPGETPRL
jgi:hypothetical protein